ncbi:uncharacterized protein LOC126284601 [Schistocerca gregaria]|uniref:uncharacterized protein LOC126284601 n=1 Tax=Schistocerca gregaria TaxID=7010 RepID=UPI00211E4D00|nr:uncharacterized protein LOC126284601 [Schistocerca gregaria]
MALTEVVKNPPFIIKAVTLVLSIIIACLTTNQEVGLGPSTHVRTAVVDGTIVAFIILGILILIGYVIGSPLHLYLILLSSAAGGILFLVSGGIMLDSYVRDPYKYGEVCGAGILALINGLVYACDVFLTWKYS